jgi:patatin-like phospholipase/acyl hydrolase
MRVREIEALFVARGRQMFARAPWFRRWWGWYRHEPLTEMFKSLFCEDDQMRTPALLGTRKLWGADVRKYLLVVMKNASTGSPWPVTNNPRAPFNDRTRRDCNLDIPIWKLLRASTAAPTYYAPERITIGTETHVFVDGGITPYNNPALIAALMATLPCYRIEWPTGVDRLLVVSIGTCRVRPSLSGATRIGLMDQAAYVPAALLSSISQEQDLLCRLLGDCRFGAALDSELRDMSDAGLLERPARKFAYVRYNYEVAAQEIEDLRSRTGMAFTLDNLDVTPWLQQLGREYAALAVQAEHVGL